MSLLRRFALIGGADRKRGGRPPPLPPQAEPAGEIAGRFGGLDGTVPADTNRPTGSGVASGRFSDGRPDDDIPLASSGDDDQPFVRCVRCRADSHRHATACQVCGASFDTPQQRVFNATLWAELRQDLAAERERHERERREELDRLQREMEERQRRATDAARVRQEEDRLVGARLFGTEASLGLQILRRIEDPRLRLAVVIGLIALPFLLWAIPGLRSMAILVSLGVALLFMPRFGRRRGRWE